MGFLSIGLSLGLEILSPAHGHVTTATTIDIVATVQPTSSAINEAVCNGEPATVAHGQIACRVALAPGRNSVVVQAFDTAGRQTSAGISVYRSAPGGLLVGPRDLTLELGYYVQLRAMTGDGRPAPATWRSSAPDVVSAVPPDPQVEEPGTQLVRAVGTGTATLSASSEAGIGDVRITVVADAPSEGAIVGTAVLPAGVELFDTVFTHQTAPEVPELHAVVRDEDRRVTLVGLGNDGEPWSIDQPHTRVPLGDWHAMGESFGGAVLFDGTDWPTGLVRTGGPLDARPWRYRASGRIDGMAQAHSGTIFLAETAADGGAAIAVLDGLTGRPLTRVPVRGSDSVESARCGLPEIVRPMGIRGWTKPIVDDAAGIVVLERHERVSYEGCTVASRDVTETLWLLQITVEGAPSWLALRSATRRLAAQEAGLLFEIGGVLPDGNAGMLVVWRLHGDPGSTGWHLTRTGGAAPATTTLPLSELDFSNVLLSNGQLVLQSTVEGRIISIDVGSGVVRWSAPTSGEFVGVRDDAIVVQAVDGQIAHVKDGRVILEKAVDGLISPSERAIMNDRIVLSHRSVANWPYFFGMALF